MSGTNVMQRLRAAGLRPTSARIGVLQVIDAAGETPLPAEEVFRRMSVRGTRVSLGTVYRLIHELETRQVLLRGWGSDRKALYWLRRTERGALGLQLVCQRTGRRVVLDDADLGARLLAAAEREGFDLAGLVLEVQPSPGGTGRYFSALPADAPSGVCN